MTTEEPMLKTAAALTLMICCLTSPDLHADMLFQHDQPPAPYKCQCDDDCKNDYYARPNCVWVPGQGHGWCDWSGPGTPCATGEAGMPLGEPGYPESDPWYEDLQNRVPAADGGVAPQGDASAEAGAVPDRSGCSVGGAIRFPGSAVLLLLGLLWALRRRFEDHPAT